MQRSFETRLKNRIEFSVIMPLEQDFVSVFVKSVSTVINRQDIEKSSFRHPEFRDFATSFESHLVNKKV
jgi:hypothetical protein